MNKLLKMLLGIPCDKSPALLRGNDRLARAVILSKCKDSLNYKLGLHPIPRPPVPPRPRLMVNCVEISYSKKLNHKIEVYNKYLKDKNLMISKYLNIATLTSKSYSDRDCSPAIEIITPDNLEETLDRWNDNHNKREKVRQTISEYCRITGENKYNMSTEKFTYWVLYGKEENQND